MRFSYRLFHHRSTRTQQRPGLNKSSRRKPALTFKLSGLTSAATGNRKASADIHPRWPCVETIFNSFSKRLERREGHVAALRDKHKGVWNRSIMSRRSHSEILRDYFARDRVQQDVAHRVLNAADLEFAIQVFVAPVPPLAVLNVVVV